MKITLRAARLNAGMTQTEAAKVAGVTVGTMSRWERGETKIPANVLAKLCDAYNWPIDSIVIEI